MFSAVTAQNSWHAANRAARGLWLADSLRGRFARGAFWSLLGAAISQGSALAASVITARILGREPFGEYGMIMNTVGMFGVFAGMGLGLTTTRYVSELRHTDPRRAGRIIALSAAVALATAGTAVVVLFAAAPSLAAHTLNAPFLCLDLRIGTGVLFLNALNGAQTGALAGFEAFRMIARVNLLRGVLTLPFSIAGVLLWGLHGAVTAALVAAAVGWILNHIAIGAECRRSGVPVCWERFWSERSILWSFSLPAFLGGALTGPVMWVASSILVNQPHGYAEMGVFSAANQCRTAVAFLPALLSQPLLPMLSNVGLGNPVAFKKLVRMNLLLNFGISVLVAAPIIFCSSWIMAAFGRDFQSGKITLILLVLATVISSTVAVIGQAIASLNKMWWGLGFNSMWAFVLLTSACLLVPPYGALGLAGAFLISYSTHGLTVAAYMQFYGVQCHDRSVTAC
jgi:O-antigen/teichoic acid export membrane protein